MDMGRYLVEAHLTEGRSVGRLAAEHGVHRSWIYKLLARYRDEGPAGLEARSRRPRSSPSATSAETEELIVALRKELCDLGMDAGADTIATHLERQGVGVPSLTTIWRVLRRRGFVVPQPKKRPKSSYVRFEADLPNECWQSDMTHWAIRDDVGVEIVNFLDDCSRLCVASKALWVTKAVDVAEIFQDARAIHGTPASVLTDNGCIYTAKHRGGRVVLETELERLGVVAKHSTPYHPQTCGKVERFHQTMKKHLRTLEPAASLEALQAQLDWFVGYYNDVRPHRALARRTPRSVFDAKVKAHPGSGPTGSHFRVRHDKVHESGSVTLRYDSKLFHIGMPKRFKNQVVTILVADRDVRVLNMEGELLRHFELDPTRDYQPQSNDLVLSTMS